MFSNLRKILFGSSQRVHYRNAPRYKYNLVPFEQAKSLIENKEVNLVDVRTRK